jgi:hypothetical protein
MVEMKDIIIRTPIAIVPDEAMATHTQELEKWANSLLPENGSPERKVLMLVTVVFCSVLSVSMVFSRLI